MEYPAKVMKAKELVAIGWPEKYLRQIYNTPGQKCAWKMNNAVNSPILFDTDELEKFRRARCAN